MGGMLSGESLLPKEDYWTMAVCSVQQDGICNIARISLQLCYSGSNLPRRPQGPPLGLGYNRKKIACSRCDEDFALRVSQQTVKCFHPMCLRMLVVDWELVKWANEGEDWEDTLKQ